VGQQSERDSGGNDIPFTSDSFLATFGVVDFFPMTVLWSQSTVAPSMSIAVVVYAGGGCGRGYTLSMSCSFLIKHPVTLTRRAAAECRHRGIIMVGYHYELLRIFIYESDNTSLTPCQYSLSTYPLISSLVSHAKSIANGPLGSTWPARMCIL